MEKMADEEKLMECRMRRRRGEEEKEEEEVKKERNMDCLGQFSSVSLFSGVW